MTLLDGDWRKGTPGEEGFSVKCATAPTHNFHVARFGLHRFGQGTLLGMYRWLILSLTAYFIAHWTYLSTQPSLPPDWSEAAQTALESIFPKIVVSLLLLDIERLIPLALSCGFHIHISRCKM
jgi:hypothetical protein